MFVPMMSAGIRSGVNWMRLKSRSSASARVRTRSVLPRPGHAFEQGVAADEQAGQHAVDDLVVADDHLADLGLHLVVSRAEVLGRASIDSRRRLAIGGGPFVTVTRFSVDRPVDRTPRHGQHRGPDVG